MRPIRKCFLLTLWAIVAVATMSPQPLRAAEVDRPNFLFIMADDCTYNVLGCYGGRNVATPNIDRLAADGMQFRYAYVAMAMCAPCRHELYTGLYPVRNGSAWNHSVARPGTKSVCHHLGELDYRVALAGKVHVGPVDTFPFIKLPGFDPRSTSPTADYDCGPIREFMADDAGPFCLFVCSTNPHAPWTVGDASVFDRAQLELPPVFADTEVVRERYAHYLAEVAELDRQVGDILASLEESGRAADTLVVFCSEQGWQFAGAKWTNWDLGLHTALVARWPGRIAPGSVTDALVQLADVVPTFVEAAGGDPSAAQFDGTSFLDVLLDEKPEHRRYVYGMHNNVPEGPPYPIRTIRTREFRYIMNLTPDAQYVEKHIEMPDRSEWWVSWKEAARTDPHASRMMDRFYYRPAEELYRTNDDPFELANLADEAELATTKAELRGELIRWMDEQRDTGISMDTEESLQENRRAAGRR